MRCARGDVTFSDVVGRQRSQATCTFGAGAGWRRLAPVSGERFVRILITGGCGFIGSAMIRHLIRETSAEVLNLDKLTYAACPEAVAEVEADPRYHFLQCDICDSAAARAAFATFRPDAVVNFAAETHVDRSIDSPRAFVQSNTVGVVVLLEEALAYWRGLAPSAQADFRFLQISTDEVFGTLPPDGMFDEHSALNPNSPYAASKAAAEMMVRVWDRTYGLPVLVTNCANNYGLWQFPEKLIPLMILRALRGELLPVYGDGLYVRDWLHVDDHARAIGTVLTAGRPGETYLIGAGEQAPNLLVVETICDLVDELAPPLAAGPRRRLITFVPNRPGHDRRYAIDASKIRRELGWRAEVRFAEGLRSTVAWYLDHPAWCTRMLAVYNGQRLGLTPGASPPS